VELFLTVTIKKKPAVRLKRDRRFFFRYELSNPSKESSPLRPVSAADAAVVQTLFVIFVAFFKIPGFLRVTPVL
jgi:hypothetical protein